MKFYRNPLAFFMAIMAMVMLASTPRANAANTDIWSLGGQGVYWAQDMVKVDSGYDFRLYNGDVVFGANGLNPSTNNSTTTPSTTVGGYYGVKVPFFNGASASTANGMIIIASATFNSSTTFEGSFASVAATTTILGVADGVYASGAIGYMTVSGYALVLTTGAVKIGDLLVSTNTTAGYAGVGSGTIAVGTVIGKALTVGPAAGGLVLSLINNQ